MFLWNVFGLLLLLAFFRIYDKIRNKSFGKQVSTTGHKVLESTPEYSVIRVKFPHPVNASEEKIKEFLDKEYNPDVLEKYIALCDEHNAPDKIRQMITDRLTKINTLSANR
jgi:hypothetical protein